MTPVRDRPSIVPAIEMEFLTRLGLSRRPPRLSLSAYPGCIKPLVERKQLLLQLGRWRIPMSKTIISFAKCSLPLVLFFAVLVHTQMSTGGHDGTNGVESNVKPPDVAAAAQVQREEQAAHR